MPAIADTNICCTENIFQSNFYSFLVSLNDIETKDLYLSIGPTGKQTILHYWFYSLGILAEVVTQLEREKK